MLIQHVGIQSMAGTDFECGDIRIANGKIAELGEGLQPRAGEETLEARGLTAYPGFIDAHTHLGMWEDGLSFEGDDGNEETDPITPQLRAIDAVNPMDRTFEEACKAGVTTVITGPGSANPIAGQMAAVKTYGKRIDSMIIKEPLAIKMALGENPKSIYHGKDRSPSTRMATAALIREQLQKARRYLEDSRQAQEDDDCSEPEYDMRCEALLPALRREIQVHFHAHRADDMFTALRIAKEFDLDYVLVHGTEGYLIADELRQEGARVLCGPLLTDRSKPELRGLTPQAPGILAKAGLLTAIVTDHPVIPLQYLPLCAGLAVREGMNRLEALRAITCNPAKICGIADRVGSIEPGKDADLVLFEGDPLSLACKPSMVFAGGNQIR